MKELIIEQLVDNILQVADLDREVVVRAIGVPKDRSHGDLAFPCFILAKLWKISPPECANKLKAELSLPETVTSVQVIGPYLNFCINREEFIRGVLCNGSLPHTEVGAGKKVLVEYSSVNIAKPFHVGHLRATLVGNCLDRVYRELGYDVTSINYLGDWGTQFGFVWAGCELWGKPNTPSVKELVGLYRRATGLKESQENENTNPQDAALPNVNELARKYFLDLENNEPYAREFWQWCRDISMEYLQDLYARLHISFDEFTGESRYADKLDEVKEALESAGLLTESLGAVGVELGEELGFARILTPDGRSLYLTRDIAVARDRATRFTFEKSIYVAGAPQALHFKQLKEIIKRLGEPYAERMHHVAFGHVLGMKTRGEGTVIELDELLNEALTRARESYRDQVSKRPEGLNEDEVAHAVSLAAIILSTLSRSRLKDVHFSWEHALAFQGDSGPYLLYAYARINGVKERALAAGITPSATADISLLTEESAYQLAATIDSFGSTLVQTAAENEPSLLTTYALDLAKAFSKAYNELHVVGAAPEVAKARLSLFEATRKTLAQAIRLLGCTLVDRM